MVPEDIHVLISGTYKYATFHGKRDFADVIKLRALRLGGDPGLHEWVLNMMTRNLQRRECLLPGSGQQKM